jgi:hypothetical protein
VEQNARRWEERERGGQNITETEVVSCHEGNRRTLPVKKRDMWGGREVGDSLE